MGAGIDEIRICEYHQDKEQVPLIFTMAFPQNEYWCPACGYTCGMMGAGEIVTKTIELEKSSDGWNKKGKEYLSAISAKTCSSMIYKDKRVTYEELPEAEKNRLQKIEDDWKYKYEY